MSEFKNTPFFLVITLVFWLDIWNGSAVGFCNEFWPPATNDCVKLVPGDDAKCALTRLNVGIWTLFPSPSLTLVTVPTVAPSLDFSFIETLLALNQF